jgi:hypothetical protein
MKNELQVIWSSGDPSTRRTLVAERETLQYSADPTSAFGDMPTAALRGVPAAPVDSTSKQQPQLHCASLSPSPALCLTISPPSARSNTVESAA